MSTQMQSTTYIVAGEPIEFPDVASGTAIKNAAKRFGAAFGLADGAAFAFAAAMVDPAGERNKIDAKDPTEHLNMIQTPSGLFLACHSARVWPFLVSGDGSNGRSRYTIQTTGSNGSRSRPWPIGRHHHPAMIDYHTPSLDDMIHAARKSAETIRSPQLITQIAQNPRGIWNPPVVVIARAFIRHDDGTTEERWFLHTIEGSTRVEGSHELTGTEPGAPLLRSDDPLDHLREAHQRTVERFDTLPTSFKSLAAARAATMPALVVVAVMDADGTQISNGFPDVINDYVESVHVQPRPFDPVAQSNVLGERFLLTMRHEGAMPEDEVDALLGREHTIPGKPSVRAASLVHAVCDPRKERFVRQIVVTEPKSRLTKGKRAALVGPLVVRQFDAPAEAADRALMRPFTPDPLLDSSWTISGADSETLRQAALAEFETETWDEATLELMARGGPALCAAGLLLSDQGSTVDGIPELRGNVDKVIEHLACSRGGINVLADAVAWADGERVEKPRKFTPGGDVVTIGAGNEKEEVHYGTTWRSGNMEVRALAFTDGVIRSGGGNGDADGEGDEGLTPEQLYERAESNLLAALVRAETYIRDILGMTDEHGRRLLKRLGMREEPQYTELPKRLTRMYSRFGPEDPIDDLDDDAMPDGAACASDEQTEDDED